MAVTKVDYPKFAVKAAESVLLELIHILGEYRDSIVVIGGMVPRYLIKETEEPHVGTTDVDLALDHRRFDEPSYQTLHTLLTSHHYQRDREQPFIYRREIMMDGKNVSVQVDLLSGEYGGTGKERRTQKIQDIRPRKARGADLAFDEPVRVTITGTLPNGAIDEVTIPIAAIVPFIVMKAMAMRDRLKPKDPYDIYYCLRYFPGGIKKIVEQMQLLKGNKLVQEALDILKEKFASPEHVGPSHIAEFQELSDPDEADRTKRDAYERVLYLVESSNN
ncbi:MAG: GSU2403 family nucleotidyltransferase fold protein [Nitrospira sp.]|nr:GSU2403 family nucleotidyltransferase fold protein [Nitrospira sp.]MCY3955944.1 GSU2403 family nucleotidyltransferase fold protein [Nitrospira sp.]MCY4131724.1 GSU2403 family nucleotidyltransferase fold protein [Nitrospira sp.]